MRPRAGLAGRLEHADENAPRGYSSANCTQVSSVTTALASVHCGQNTDSAWSRGSGHRLVPHVDDREAAIRAYLGGLVLATCPPDGPSPITSHYTPTPDQQAGSLACGTYNRQRQGSPGPGVDRPR